MTTDVAATVERDLACVRCRYQLRDLPVAGRCPECSAQIIRSIRGDLLELAAPEHVQSLRDSATIVYWSVAVLLFIPSGMLGCAVLFGLIQDGAVSINVWLDWFPIFPVLIGITLVSLLIGWWKLTRRDPEAIGVDEGLTSRRMVRASLVVVLGAAAVATTCFFVPLVPSRTGFSRWLDVLLLALTVGPVAIHLIVAGVYLTSLGRRLANKTLVSRAQIQTYFGSGVLLSGAAAFGGFVVPLLGLLALVAILCLLISAIAYCKAIEDAKFSFDGLATSLEK
jgi:hypothetical protein